MAEPVVRLTIRLRARCDHEGLRTPSPQPIAATFPNRIDDLRGRPSLPCQSPARNRESGHASSAKEHRWRPRRNIELDEFLSTTLAKQIEAERAIHDGDVAAQLEMWSMNDPVTLFGACGPVTADGTR